MNPFDIWLDAVVQSVRSNGGTISKSMIDPTLALQAFNAGTSPAVFARNVPTVSPSATPRTLPPITPNREVIWMTYRCLSVCGWLCWIVACLSFIAFAAIDVAAIASDKGVSGITVLACLIQGGYVFGFTVSGSLWHYLAQRLALAVNQ